MGYIKVSESYAKVAKQTHPYFCRSVPIDLYIIFSMLATTAITKALLNVNIVPEAMFSGLVIGTATGPILSSYCSDQKL